IARAVIQRQASPLVRNTSFPQYGPRLPGFGALASIITARSVMEQSLSFNPHCHSRRHPQRLVHLQEALRPGELDDESIPSTKEFVHVCDFRLRAKLFLLPALLDSQPYLSAPTRSVITCCRRA